MNNEEFVGLINKNVRKTVVGIVESDLRDLSADNKILKELSEWYNKKDDAEKEIIGKLITRVYDCAAWRILMTLDSGNKYGGDFELYFKDNSSGEKISLIDPPVLDELHELYTPEFNE